MSSLEEKKALLEDEQNTEDYGTSSKNATDSKNTVRFSDFQSAKYIVVPKEATDMHAFVDNLFFGGNELKLPKNPPQAIISVQGGSQYYETYAKLDLVIKRGFIKAAESLGAWIIDGGTNAGVSKYLGNCIRSSSMKEVTCIGVAPLNKIFHAEKFKRGHKFTYALREVAPDCTSNNLDPNHTHFILVESDTFQWGEEVDFLNKLRWHLFHVREIPIISIVLNGGAVTLTAMLHGLKAGYPTIVVAGSGRGSDALVTLIRCAKKYQIQNPTCENIYKMASKEELLPCRRFVTHEREAPAELKKILNKILRQKHAGLITIFDLEDEADDSLDNVVLQKFLAISKLNTETKIIKCIEWDKEDLVKDLLQHKVQYNNKNNNIGHSALYNSKDSDDEEIEDDDDEKSTPIAETSEINLSKPLLYSLVHDRPTIFHLLCDHHARFMFPLRVLYKGNGDVLHQINRGHSHPIQAIMRIPETVRTKLFSHPTRKRQETHVREFEEAMDILESIGPVFADYVALCSSYCNKSMNEAERLRRLEFIDLLMWAVFINRMELAKVIWIRTKYHVHSAVMACILYRSLAPRAARQQEYLDNANWFESEAIRIVNTLDYDTAKQMIIFQSNLMLGSSTLADIAAEGDCKLLMAHPHFQQHIDEELNSCGVYAIQSNMNTFHLLFNIITYFPRSCFAMMRSCVEKHTPSTKELFEIMYLATKSRSVSNTDREMKTHRILPPPSSPPIIYPRNGDPNVAPPNVDPSNGNPANGNPASGNPASGNPASGNPANGDPANGNPANGNPAKGDPSKIDPPTADEIDVENIFLEQQTNTFSQSSQMDLKQAEIYLLEHPRTFFNIPIVKFWTNTLFYFAFLTFQAFVLINYKEDTIHPTEYILWVWVCALTAEELWEASSSEVTGYFSRFTNKVDIALVLLNMAYVSLRVANELHPRHDLFIGSINCFLASSLISWLRLLAIFPISSTFGPLFFILVKLFTRDFILWSVLFGIFAVSFQIGFTSLAQQAGFDPMRTYPSDEGVFPVSLATVIGEWDYLMEMMQHTATGVVCLAIYAFIVQVMLINLLIAMMGDTYASMRENSDVQWKYYRFVILKDNQAASPFPPPLNIIYVLPWLLKFVVIWIPSLCINRIPPVPVCQKHYSKIDPDHPCPKCIEAEHKMAKVMRVTVDRLAEVKEREESQSTIVQITKAKKAFSQLFSRLSTRVFDNNNKNDNNYNNINNNNNNNVNNNDTNVPSSKGKQRM